MARNYTLGRGKVHFARFKPGTQVPDGFFYIGNTPEFSLTIESESLDHFSSDEGIREKDDSVPLEVNRTGSLTTDNIDPENVALFFFGSSSVITQAAVASATETLTGIKAGHSYKLGVGPTNPAGYMGIDTTGFTVEVGVTPLVVDVDYTMDFDNGVITFLPDSVLAVDAADVDVTYAVAASTRSRVISGSEPVEGAMMYITKNPKGTDCTFYMPYVKVMPNGDYALKGDEWQQIPLALEVLKPLTGEAIYRDGTPTMTP
ncbi:tail length tape measure protein [Synechococcus virus S-ESS1]|uniref:Tail length tape measure protein n=1 Tax=Synechococcus virus S-ESS1 TaxID=1964565 RepID=A0A1V0DX22_9CAUD|nr:major tail protein with Ig-like domain [Synechococcus virus S-ESS1]ARB05716.1 tail length tape measure protein [Synechococcus virus S-ESS1]